MASSRIFDWRRSNSSLPMSICRMRYKVGWCSVVSSQKMATKSLMDSISELLEGRRGAGRYVVELSLAICYLSLGSLRTLEVIYTMRSLASTNYESSFCS